VANATGASAVRRPGQPDCNVRTSSDSPVISDFVFGQELFMQCSLPPPGVNHAVQDVVQFSWQPRVGFSKLSTCT
jgi:hypothetical protein